MLRTTPDGDLLAERVNTFGYAAKQKYGTKVIRLSFDAGFTCPNRDGTLGTGGCLFCGDMAGSAFSTPAAEGKSDALSFAEAARKQAELLSRKWPDAAFLAYFQNHTNTYAPAPVLRGIYEEALRVPGIRGLIIGTRPDCLPEETLDLLSELSERCILWVELGLQTILERTARLINRCYPLETYDRAVHALRSRGIPVVTHLILGLPGETKEDMTDSVRYVCGLPDRAGRAGERVAGIKLHLLNVIRGSRLAEEYPDYVPFSSIDEYVSLVCDLLEQIPENVVIHRLTADAPRKILIAPEWSCRKRPILNGIGHELRRRGTWQGAALARKQRGSAHL